MKFFLIFIINILIFEAILAIDCPNINFNDGNLHLKKCTTPLSRFPPWAVLKFYQVDGFRSRDNKTTNYIGRPTGNGTDVCVETDFYEVDEFSYVVLGYYLDQLKKSAHGQLVLQLNLDGNRIDEKYIRHNNAAKNWRSLEVEITKKGILLVSRIIMIIIISCMIQIYITFSKLLELTRNNIFFKQDSYF